MIETKILTRKKFSSLVEYKVRLYSLSYIDACLEVCEEEEYPPEDINKVLSTPLLEKIEAEARKNKLVKGSTSAMLPI
jgi:hypothetical protein